MNQYEIEVGIHFELILKDLSNLTFKHIFGYTLIEELDDSFMFIPFNMRKSLDKFLIIYYLNIWLIFLFS